MTENENEDLRVGNIVEITDSTDRQIIDCLGEVVSVGPPVQVAVVHILPFEPSQLSTYVDFASLSWNELRAKAKSLDIRANGTRLELEAKIRERMKADRCVTVIAQAGESEDESPNFGIAATAAESPTTKFRVGQRVEVKANRIRGRVLESGPPVLVRLTLTREERTFAEDELDAL